MCAYISVLKQKTGNRDIFFIFTILQRVFKRMVLYSKSGVLNVQII